MEVISEDGTIEFSFNAQPVRIERSTRITLTENEMLAAGLVGLRRRMDSVLKGIKDQRHSPRDEPWQMDIEGAMSEMAFAKYLGAYWGCDVGTFKAPDVGGMQVRSVREDHHRLIIRHNDPGDQIFVLVAGTIPSYRIVGWIYGKDGRRDEWVDSPNGGRPAHMVPQEGLRPMKELPWKPKF